MQQVERFWAIENYGLAGDSNMCMSVEDKKALEIIERSVKLDHGHCQVALPWRQYQPFLPYNRPWQNEGLKYGREGFYKMKNSLNVETTWKSTLLRNTQERYRLTSSCRRQAAAVVFTSPPCAKQAWQDQSSLRLCSQVRRNIS